MSIKLMKLFLLSLLSFGLLACSQDKDKDGDKTKKFAPLSDQDKQKAKDLFQDIGRVEKAASKTPSSLNELSNLDLKGISNSAKLTKIKSSLSSQCQIEQQTPSNAWPSEFVSSQFSLKVSGTQCPLSADYQSHLTQTTGLNIKTYFFQTSSEFKVLEQELAALNDIFQLQMRGSSRVVIQQTSSDTALQMFGNFQGTLNSNTYQQGSFLIAFEGKTSTRNSFLKSQTTETYQIEFNDLKVELQITSELKDQSLVQTFLLNGETLEKPTALEYLEGLGRLYIRWNP